MSNEAIATPIQPAPAEGLRGAEHRSLTVAAPTGHVCSVRTWGYQDRPGRAARAAPPAAVLTVGTECFDALVAEVDRLVAEGRLSAQTFGQIGSGTYEPRHFAWTRYEPALWQRLAGADLIITHGGTGLVMECIDSGRPFIAVPDQRKAGNHQLEFLEALGQRFDFCWVQGPRDLEAALPDARPARRIAAPDVHELALDVMRLMHSRAGGRGATLTRRHFPVRPAGGLARLAVTAVAAVTRRCHDLPGHWRLLRWLERREHILAQLQPRTVGIGAGLRMSVDPFDENGRWVYIHGLVAGERIARQFFRVLRRGDNVLDIGANQGQFTLLAAWRVGSAGCVHAFEPNPHVARRLRRNATLNPHLKIRVHEQAVSDCCGQAQFFLAAGHRTGHSSLRNLGADATAVTRVETVTIDALLPRLPTIRLVKMDIEGAELRALRGMTGLIQRDRPFIITEMNDAFLRTMGGDAREMCRFLTERGYRLLRIGKAGRLEAVHDVPIDHCDLLACPP